MSRRVKKDNSHLDNRDVISSSTFEFVTVKSDVPETLSRKIENDIMMKIIFLDNEEEYDFYRYWHFCRWTCKLTLLMLYVYRLYI